MKRPDLCRPGWVEDVEEAITLVNQCGRLSSRPFCVRRPPGDYNVQHQLGAPAGEPGLEEPKLGAVRCCVGVLSLRGEKA